MCWSELNWDRPERQSNVLKVPYFQFHNWKNYKDQENNERMCGVKTGCTANIVLLQ